MKFESFPDIEGFHNVVKTVGVYPHVTGNAPVAYRGKIKLHGMNAGVRICGGEVAGQSRSEIVTPASEGAGQANFARWVESHKDYFLTLPERWPGHDDFTIFGEWCGNGVVKHSQTAIGKLPNKILAVFAVLHGEADSVDEGKYTQEMVVSPQTLEWLLAGRPDDIHIVPWYGEAFVVDFSIPTDLENVADICNKAVAEVEPLDPWVKSAFGIEGTGEGLVYYPSQDEHILRKRFSDLAFKAKGGKHKVLKTREPVIIAPEVAASIDEFVTMFVTEARLMQWAEPFDIFEMKNVGAFLKGFLADVIKESADELESAELTWDEVQKAVQTAARNWYIKKCKGE